MLNSDKYDSNYCQRDQTKQHKYYWVETFHLSTQIRVDRLKNSADPLGQNENFSFYPSIVRRSNPSISQSDRLEEIEVLRGLKCDLRACYSVVNSEIIAGQKN
jgi:hypothetical protein